MDIKKYLVHNFLAHSWDLVEQFCLQGGRSHALFRLEPMQYVMKFNGRHQVLVNNDCNQLPQHLNQANSSVLPPPFGMITTMSHMHFFSRSSILKSSCTLWTTILYLDLSGSFYTPTSAIQHFRFLELIPDGPSAGLAQKLLMFHYNSYSVIEYFLRWH